MGLEILPYPLVGSIPYNIHICIYVYIYLYICMCIYICIYSLSGPKICDVNTWSPRLERRSFHFHNSRAPRSKQLALVIGTYTHAHTRAHTQRDTHTHTTHHTHTHTRKHTGTEQRAVASGTLPEKSRISEALPAFYGLDDAAPMFSRLPTSVARPKLVFAITNIRRKTETSMSSLLRACSATPGSVRPGHIPIDLQLDSLRLQLPEPPKLLAMNGLKLLFLPAPLSYASRYPQHHERQTVRPLIEIRWVLQLGVHMHHVHGSRTKRPRARPLSKLTRKILLSEGTAGWLRVPPTKVAMFQKCDA